MGKTTPILVTVEELHQLLFVCAIGLVYWTFVRVRHALKQPPQERRTGLVLTSAWVAFYTVNVVGVAYQPDAEDPSVLITFAALAALFAGAHLLALCPPLDASASLALCAAYTLRLTQTATKQGYLPADITGDGLYQVLEGGFALLALTGAWRGGLTPRAAVRACVILAVGGLLASECYGDLNGDALSDRIYAAALYAEALAWVTCVPDVWKGASGLLSSQGALASLMLQAGMRSYFWWLAVDEVKPQGDVLRSMALFPYAAVAAPLVELLVFAYAGAKTLKPAVEAVAQSKELREILAA